MSSRVVVLSQHRCELGEGPSYDPLTDTLYWFDIVHGHLLAQPRGADRTEVHPLGEMASALAVVDAGRQLIATESGLRLREAATGRMSLVVPIEADNPATRSNDGRVHQSGALWIGTMGKNGERALGAIYWFYRGELRRLFAGIGIPNSICFSPDGRIAYYADTATARLMRVDCDPDNGLPVGEPKVFVNHRGGPGDIDGSVVDRDGVLWNAAWGGRAINAYAPNGALVRTVALPVAQPSCPAFFGPDADRLVVTSARQGQTPAQRREDPEGGKTFLIDIAVSGRHEPRVLLD